MKIESIENHRAFVDAQIAESWAGPYIVTRGVLQDTRTHPGFAAVENGAVVGYILYNLSQGDCEITVLESIREGQGVGSALIKAVLDAAKAARCGRVWLVTTNDNTHAIRFYQRFGFALRAVHIDAITQSRNLKPQISLTGCDGIPIAHEFEFEMHLCIADRTVYASNDLVSLVSYQPIDDRALYESWLDPDVQNGFNGIYVTSFEEFAARDKTTRFTAMIRLNGTGEIIGTVGLSPPEDIADLTIRIFKPYRGKGYGTAAFALATKYIVDTLGITDLHAGAYPDNIASQRMLKKCGYVPFSAGNIPEKHYITGEDIVQMDYIYSLVTLPDATRTITGKLREALEPLPFIYALWLEGADAVGTADAYSDIDFWVHFEDEYEEQAIAAVETALSELAEIDYKYVMQHDHPKIRQRIYHLAGTSEYLMIDFCWQLHSRPKDEYVYIENDSIEAAKVIFDKDNIIRHKPFNPAEYTQWNKKRLEEAKYRRTQHIRAEKYVCRGQYLEAYAYYNKYVLEPLIDLLRLLYTPTYAHYYLIHISQHIPPADREKLEYFAQVGSLEDLAKKILQAGQWFDELAERYDNNQSTAIQSAPKSRTNEADDG